MSDKLNADIARVKGWEQHHGPGVPIKVWWYRPEEGKGCVWRLTPPPYTTDAAEWGPLFEELVPFEPSAFMGLTEDGKKLPTMIVGNMEFTGPTIGVAVCEAWLAVKGEGE